MISFLYKTFDAPELGPNLYNFLNAPNQEAQVKEHMIGNVTLVVCLGKLRNLGMITQIAPVLQVLTSFILNVVCHRKQSCSVVDLDSLSNSAKHAVFSTAMGPLQVTITWYKIHHTGDKVAFRDIQNKATSSSQI